MGEAALTSRREPLAGPGPDSLASTGTPVSAMVGVSLIVGREIGFIESGDVIGIEEVLDEIALGRLFNEGGRGAGERLRADGLMGGGNCLLGEDIGPVESAEGLLKETAAAAGRVLTADRGGVTGILDCVVSELIVDNSLA